MNTHHHTIVIGAGSGGLTVAIGLAALGKPVLLVEAKHVGGDCTNVGCIPSKTLIHLAKQFIPGMDAKAVLQEVTRKRDALREKETAEIRHVKNLTFVVGTARFVATKTLAVRNGESEQTYTADHIVIATGSRPRLLTIPGLPTEKILTNESLFDLTDLPQHLVIAGAGVIALEMAFAFRKLGSQVTIFALDERPLATAIPEASDALAAELARAGVVAYFGATAEQFDPQRACLTLVQNSQRIEIAGVSQVLLAVGRVRNLESLELERAGIVANAKQGVLVNAVGETNVKGVFAIGDVTATSAYTHSANAQGRRVTQRIALPFLPVGKREPLYPSAVFSNPEVATVGMSQAEIAERFHPQVLSHIRVDFKTLTDRGYTDDVENGFIFVTAVRVTGRILHVTIVGRSAAEMISFFTLAIAQNISLYKIYRLVYPYPTFSSGILKVADTFMRQTLPNLRSELLAYLRYRWG
ncbi:MAG TPA: NAD(P)/FAD-dependent oxidoreductase [Anaerolineales bacterium]|nr:NAD(P)/FAD-dependent oxidoreductase [Anaerolineales bacterium]